MNGFYFNERQYQVAQNYQEMSAWQLGMVFWLIGIEKMPVQITRYVILIILTTGKWDRLCLLWMLLGPSQRPNTRPARFLSRIFWPEIVNEPDREELLYLTEFVFTNELQLTDQKFPTIRIGLRKLYGPTAQLRSLTFAQFYNAETFFFLYTRTKDFKWLTHLAAVLYLPHGETWTKEDDPTFDERVKLCSKLKAWQLLYIFIFYDGCHSYLHTKYPKIFPKPSTNQTTSKKPNPREIRDNWRVHIRAAIAKEYVNLHHVDQGMLYNVLDHLQYSIEEAKRMKEEIEKSRKKS